MASFGMEVDEDDLLDQHQQPDQGGDGFMSDDDGFPGQQPEQAAVVDDDDAMSDDYDYGFVGQPQPAQGDTFTIHLTGAVRSYTHDGFDDFHFPGSGTGAGAGCSFSEHYYFDLTGGGGGGGGDYAEDEDDGDAFDDDDYAFPMQAPPAAASEEAIAALEAAEAPADDFCPVCLLQDDGAAWSRVAPCGHRFHAACVGAWLRVKLSCPVCRGPAAAPAPAACHDAAEVQLQRPLPDIVDEMLDMSFEESVLFESSPRWLAFLDDEPLAAAGYYGV